MPTREIALNRLYVWTWGGYNLKFVPTVDAGSDVYRGMLFRGHGFTADTYAHVQARELVDAIDFVTTS